MADINLQKYIDDLRNRKIPDASIKEQLLKSGWPQIDVDKAFMNITSGVDLPPPPVPHFGMWVTFQYFILFLSLYVSATAFGGILHFAADKLIPDGRGVGYIPGDFMDFLVKGYLAGIIVAYPIFAILFIVVNKQLIANPAIKNLSQRKMLIYITLAATFIIMICHLIATVYGFLTGTATLNSIAHLCVTFFVAGSIFGYLLVQVKQDRKPL